MTITKRDVDAAVARLVEAFPQTFVLEKHRPHRPLKVGSTTTSGNAARISISVGARWPRR